MKKKESSPFKWYLVVVLVIGGLGGLALYQTEVWRAEWRSVCENEGWEYLDWEWIGGERYIECVKYDPNQKTLVKAWFPEHKGD